VKPEIGRFPNWQISKHYEDVGISGAKEKRPALNRLMDDARKRRFDSVLVFRFDRFARSTRHLVNALDEFKELGIGFISYSENIDLSSSMGTAMFTIISAMAQLERDIIRERVIAGLKAAKAKGTMLGRPKKVKRVDVTSLRKHGLTMQEIAQELHISMGSVHRYLQ